MPLVKQRVVRDVPVSLDVEFEIDINEIATQLSDNDLKAIVAKKRVCVLRPDDDDQGLDPRIQRRLEEVYEDMRGRECPRSLRDLVYDTIGRVL